MSAARALRGETYTTSTPRGRGGTALFAGPHDDSGRELLFSHGSADHPDANPPCSDPSIASEATDTSASSSAINGISRSRIAS